MPEARHRVAHTYQRIRSSLEWLVNALSEMDVEDEMPDITIIENVVFSATYSETVVLEGVAVDLQRPLTPLELGVTAACSHSYTGDGPHVNDMLSDIERAIGLHAHRFDGSAIADDVVFIAVARPLLDAIGGRRHETGTFRALYALLTRDDSDTDEVTCERQGIALRTFQRLKAGLERMVGAPSEMDAEDDGRMGVQAESPDDLPSDTSSARVALQADSSEGPSSVAPGSLPDDVPTESPAERFQRFRALSDRHFDLLADPSWVGHHESPSWVGHRPLTPLELGLTAKQRQNYTGDGPHGNLLEAMRAALVPESRQGRASVASTSSASVPTVRMGLTSAMMEAGLGLRVPAPIAKAPRRMVVVLADGVPLAAPAYSRNRPETQRTRDISKVNEARACELADAGASDVQRSRIHAGLQRV